MTGRRFVAVLAAALMTGVSFGANPGPAGNDPVDKNYYVYVAAESDDAVHLVMFGPDGGKLVKTIGVGAFATEIEGPHGIRVSPDGKHWYVSVAHGLPYGSVFKYDTSDANPLPGIRFALGWGVSQTGRNQRAAF